ncbi:MAG: hypothetical protein GX957_11170 [Clostridiaceae bacterium]|nr:hypothetical protein [Clostridiaceae bacterium]
MSKSVIPTPPQKVMITEENEERIQSLVLSDMIYDENTIMGNVSDKLTGKPIEGACIKVCDNEYGPIVYNFTDVDGNFSLHGNFSPNIRLITAKRGYETFSSEVFPSSSLEKRAVNIELTPAHNGGMVFYGNVRDMNRNPVKGIKITLFRSYSLNPYDFTFSNEEGLYLFDNIEPGIYRIVFQSQNFTEKVVNMEVGTQQPVVTLETVYLQRKALKGTIHGIITDSHGAPVDKALVVLLNSNNIPVQVTHTNQDGVYMFYRLEPGTYSIMAK